METLNWKSLRAEYESLKSWEERIAWVKEHYRDMIVKGPGPDGVWPDPDEDCQAVVKSWSEWCTRMLEDVRSGVDSEEVRLFLKLAPSWKK